MTTLEAEPARFGGAALAAGAPPALGPVSERLDAELREEVRKAGIVLFLDREGAYTAFIDELARRAPYPVCAFRGSYLELMLAIEEHAQGVDRRSLLVHLPGFVEDDVKASPFFDLYAAGKRHRRALDTLVTDAAAGRVRPEEIDAFRTGSAGGLTLAGADAWLNGKLLARASSRDGGDGFLGQLQLLTVEALVDDLLAGGFVSSRLQTNDDKDALFAHLAAATGLADSWRDDPDHGAASSTPLRPRARDIAFTLVSWALVVEYVHDLARPPIEQQLAVVARLPKPLVAVCQSLAAHVRARHPAFYEATANETETRIDEEMHFAAATDLGKIDTFLFEERAILKAALDALAAGNDAAALDWAAPRAAGQSFWTRLDPLRQNAWQLVHDAARLGAAITAAGSLGKVASVDVATARYVEKGARVDRYHRLLEQKRVAILYPQIPHFELLRVQLDEMRARWRRWADAWARDFSICCSTHGFLPAPELQQRHLFDQVVKQLTPSSGGDRDVTAYFCVDALRFEMAEELSEAIGELPATNKQLKARLAELPTVTEVGMNVLAPVTVDGRLRPAINGESIKGFASGEFRVFDPATRKRAMFDRVGGKGCPWLNLDEVLALDARELKKKVEQARLLVVHSREIDNAGEKGVGASVFDKVLQDLRAAWRLLREAGVRRFVITADHGFLILDDRMGEAKAHGRKIDPSRRHVFSSVAANHTGEVRVAVKELGYDVDGDGEVGLQLMFPDTVTVFDTGGRSQNVVHGGNSLQERVIPVLTLVHTHPIGSDSHRYNVTAEARDGVAGMHCVQASVDVVSDLLFGAKSVIELGLRAVDAEHEVVVEIGQTRGGARVSGSVIHANVGASFEVFFRLLGHGDERVRVELWHTGGDATVTSAVIDARFAVTPQATPTTEPAKTATSEKAPEAKNSSWLAELPAGGVRAVFEHLAVHGAITEVEAATMLGGQRELRKFAREFEGHATRAPFRVRIEVVGGLKRYVREGGGG